MDRRSVVSLVIDAVLIIAIISFGYKIWCNYEDIVSLCSSAPALVDADTEDDDAEIVEDKNTHPLRDCHATSSNTHQIVVDLSFSKETPLQPLQPTEIEEIGDKLLSQFFTVSSMFFCFFYPLNNYAGMYLWKC